MIKRVALMLFGMALSCADAQTWTCAVGEHALTSGTKYSSTNAGFDMTAVPSSITRAGCSSEKPFFVSFPIPEGNYKVTVELGSGQAGVTTVRAEARRLMAAKLATGPGKYKRVEFVVNVRRPQIADNGEVHRKPREMRSLDWDEKLTLGFAGDHPSMRNIRIEPASPSTITVYLAGDSTVVDQENEPWAAWGQMLPAFFDSSIAIANNAESGETIASFESEKRFAKIFSVIRPGDYLFLQFAHNDQKPGKGNVSPEEYAADLRRWIAAARDKGATPVLVTSMNRRTFDETGHVTDSLAPYPQTMRTVAEQEQVTLLDLNAMSKTLYEAVGEAHSRDLFVYAPANTYPGQTEPLHDDTHFNNYGALELAQCIAYAINETKLPLRSHLRPAKSGFSPSKPDSPAEAALPTVPFVDTEKPYER